MSVFDGSHGHAVTVDGYVRVDAGANLELIGTIHNDGMIDVDGQKTDLVIDGSVTLDGGGVITLDNAAHPADQIVGVSDTEEYSTLYNVDNTIRGRRQYRHRRRESFARQRALRHDRCKSVGQTLTLDTGNAITNRDVRDSNGGTSRRRSVKTLAVRSSTCVESRLCEKRPGHGAHQGRHDRIRRSRERQRDVRQWVGETLRRTHSRRLVGLHGPYFGFSGASESEAAHSDEIELGRVSDAPKLKTASATLRHRHRNADGWDATNSADTTSSLRRDSQRDFASQSPTE